MEELVEKSGELSQKIDLSMEMTQDIDKQVSNVAEMVEHIVGISQKSSEHAKNSTVELEEIRNLSLGTQTSSGSIMDALGLLEEISGKMTQSVTDILHLISKTLEAMQHVSDSVGGFMNIEDIKEGMLVEVIHEESLGILNSEVLEMVKGGIIISGGEKEDTFFKGIRQKQWKVRIVVENALYMWSQTSVKKIADAKYEITVGDKTFQGRMENICAGGYALVCKDDIVVSNVGEKVKVKIHNFDVTEGKALTAVLIRCTNNHGECIVGCRMIEDNQKF